MNLRNTSDSYGSISIGFHWVVALLFIVQLPLGYLTQAASRNASLQASLYVWHESVGYLILAVSLVRLCWWFANQTPALPSGLTDSEKGMARTSKPVMLVLMIVVPLAGWITVSVAPPGNAAYGVPIAAVLQLPLDQSGAAAAIWSSVHAFLAYCAGFVAAVHILAAFRHHFQMKDDTLRRMLRPGRRP